MGEVNLEARSIGMYYGKDRILNDVTMDFQPGEFYVIKGPSGAGKTTLLNILSTLEKPVSGEVRFLGKDIYSLNEDEKTKIRREYMGYIFQQFLLNPRLSALENVILPMLAVEKDYSACEKYARTLLQEVGLDKKMKSLPYDLSGGEQQRVAIARCFANNPLWIFADEPTGNLDKENEKIVFQLLTEFRLERKCCVIMVSHGEASEKYASKTVYLSEGILRQVRI